MTDQVFAQGYADSYDLLYGEKDYQRECDLIEEVFRRHGNGQIKSVLDLGCGTGNHALPLARRGYQVLGIDLSQEMLQHARDKAQAAGLAAGQLEFAQGDVRSFSTPRRFDAALMMFAVLGYQLTNEDVLAALRTVRDHLNPGGLFICDVWYGPAVLAVRPSDRVKVIPMANGQLIRAASGTLDTYRHLCEVRYHLWRLTGDHVDSETQETHRMRYFFPQELSLFLGQTRFSMLDIRSFDDPESSPTENTWNVLVTGTRNR
jgi:SAM-dependent methyltransferase